MMYPEARSCCPAPGNEIMPSPEGIGGRLAVLNELCMGIMYAVGDLHVRTYGGSTSPDIERKGDSISETIDSATEAARTSLAGLKAYLDKL